MNLIDFHLDYPRGGNVTLVSMALFLRESLSNLYSVKVWLEEVLKVIIVVAPLLTVRAAEQDISVE